MKRSGSGVFCVVPLKFGQKITQNQAGGWVGGGSGKRIPPPPLEASLDDSQQSTSLTQSKLKPTIIDQLINPRKKYQPVLFIYWKRYIYLYI